MERKSVILLLLFILTGSALNAQIRSISVISEAKRQGTNQSTRLVLTSPAEKQSKKKNGAEDFVLYREVIRKYTWFEGVGAPISQEVANYLPFYYKMSMKNENGHWQHIEAMHQDKMTTRHKQTTYVLDKQNDDDGNNKEWIDKLRTVAQWFITSDLDGDEVVEERAYTDQGDLVYSFMPIKNADGRITGSYNDAWGLPADMREDPAATYGSVVCITYDKCGRDSIIDFLDGQGLRKYNSNGVDQQRYIYDDKDRVVLATSHNMVGDYIIDNWGNCGNRYVYDDANNKYSIIRVDKELKPMRMPSTRADGTRTFIRCDIKRDVWGRDVEAIMLDADGRADATNTGIHKIMHQYDNTGNILSTLYYGLDGQMVNKEKAFK